MMNDNSGYLNEKLKDLFGRDSITKNLKNIIYNEGHAASMPEDIPNIKMTEPHEFILKDGKIEFVKNFRYLEFLRNNKGPIVLENDNNRFVIAIGKNNKESVQPDGIEIYIFNVNEKDEERIENICDDLERFMVALVAERYEIPPLWGSKIIESLDLLKVKLIGEMNDDIEFEKAFGKYCGEVYAAMSCVGYINFPMRKEYIKNYMNKTIVQLNKAITDGRVYHKIIDNTNMQDLLYKLKKEDDKDLYFRLNLLEKQLNNIFEQSSLMDSSRPLYLLEGLESGFNCELFVSLVLFLITHYRILFPEVEIAQICCLPPDFLKEHSIYTNYPHMILIFVINKKPCFIDPTGVIEESKKNDALFDSIIQNKLYHTYKIMSITGDVGEINQINDELFSEHNMQSEYCLISSLRCRTSAKRLFDYIGGFVSVIEKKVDAGLPQDSLIDTVRRLLILLSRNPGINKIIILKEEDEKIKKFYNFLSRINHINSNELEMIYLRGRFYDYGIDKETANVLLSRIILIKIFDINELNSSELVNCLALEASLTEKLELPDRSKSFKLYPTKRSIDCKFRGKDEFGSIKELFNYAEGILVQFGEIGRDRDNIERIQLKEQFSIKIKEFNDLYDFLKIMGIEDAEKIYKKYVKECGIFANRFFGGDDFEICEHFLMDIAKAIKEDRLCYSKVLSLVTKKEDSKFDQTQVGWESITPYLGKDSNGEIVLSFAHTLRSVDLYDGLPFNILFCIEISKEIKEKLEEKVGIAIHLGLLDVTIRHLHAYHDSIPLKVKLGKGL